MELSEWARASGVSRRSATWWFHAGVFPVPARQLAAGTIVVEVADRSADGVAIYARVSCSDQRAGLDRQVARLAVYLAANGIAPSKIISGVGSGLDGHRARLLGLVRDASVGTIVGGHRERLARFGVVYLEAALAAQGRKLIVVGQAEVSDDLVTDVVEVLAGFCARLYGRRSAKRRAELALAAASTDQAA